MIKLSTFAKLLTETMSLYIRDADYTKHDTLWDLSIHLQRVAYKIIDSLPDDQQRYFNKNRPSDLLTIDGLDMDASSGVLNLYYSGYTQHTLQQIISAVKSELEKLKVNYGEFKQEKSNMYNYQVIRIPILQISQTYTGAPELNMSNRNAYHIFKNVLQFEADDESGSSFSFSADELKDRVESILKHDPEWIEKHKINRLDSDWPDEERGESEDFENPHQIDIGGPNDGVRIIRMGLSSDDIRYRLYKIWDIADWAIKHNKDKLYVA